MSTYTVYCVEQYGRQAWSRHATRERALAAARRYARRNRGSHYPFEVQAPDGRVTLVSCSTCELAR